MLNTGTHDLHGVEEMGVPRGEEGLGPGPNIRRLKGGFHFGVKRQRPGCSHKTIDSA